MKDCHLQRKAVKYFLGLLDTRNAEQYLQHLKKCKICSRKISKLNKIKKASLFRKKIKSELPPFTVLKHKLETSNKSKLKTVFNIPEFKLIPRFALVFSCIVVAILLFLGISIKKFEIYYKKGEVRYKANRITTSENSECHITYKKNIFMKIGPDTSVDVKRTIKQNHIKLLLKKGSILISKEKEIDFNLIVSGINIRALGTKFLVEKNDKLNISLLEGKLLINKKIGLDSNHKAQFKKDGCLQFKKKLSDKERIKLSNLCDSLYFVKKWEHKIKGIIKAEPVIYNNRIYYGTTGGSVYCMEKNTGELIWKNKFNAGIEVKPEIKEGYIYIALNNGELAKLNSKTGELSWKIEIGTLSYSSPFYYKNKIFIGNTDGYIKAISADKGAIIWEKRVKGGIFAPILCWKNRIYAGSTEGGVYCLDIKNGDILWQKEVEGRMVGSGPLICSEGVIFSITGGYVYCFDLHNGDQCWKYKMQGEIFNSPVQLSGRFYFPADGIFILNSKGKLVSKKGINLNNEINISSAKNTVAYVDNFNNIKLLDIENNQLKNINFKEQVSSIVMDKDKIYILTESNKIVAFDFID